MWKLTEVGTMASAVREIAGSGQAVFVGYIASSPPLLWQDTLPDAFRLPARLPAKLYRGRS